MGREPLSGVDAAWLRMEDPTNLMMVTGVLLFDEHIDIDRLRDVLQKRLLAFRRFKQRIVQPLIRGRVAHWEDDPYFDIDAHLHRIALPRPGGDKELQEICGDLISTPLDFTKPLWQFHVVEGYGTGSAVVVRMHHCIADGIALVYVMLSLTDTTAEGRRTEVAPKRISKGSGPLGFLSTEAVEQGLELLFNPKKAADIARFGASGAATFGKTVLKSPDPKTVFKGKLGVIKTVSWSKRVALDDVKAIGKANGATVNDVLVTAATGALRRYLTKRGENVNGLEIRASVPVNLRPLDQAHRLGNHFGIVFLSLPVGISDAARRLKEIKQRMDAIKQSPEAVVALGVLALLGTGPAEVQKLGLSFFASKATAVLTNVPGPREPLYLAGSKIDNVMFWVPMSGHLALGISILSYAGNVQLGINTDAGLIPDPEVITDAFEKEFEALKKLHAPTRTPKREKKVRETLV